MGNCSDILSWFFMFQHKVPYAAVLLAFSPIATLFNITLLASFVATKQLTQNTSNILICASSISDLLNGVFCMPFTASILLNMTSDDVCIKLRIWFCFGGNGYYSVFLTTLLAMDRYLHMNPDFRSHPSRIGKIFEKRNIYYLILTTAIISISAFAVGGLGISGKATFAITNVFIYLSSLYVLIITILYIRGYMRIRKFTDNNPVYNQPIGSTNTTPDYVRRLYKTVFVLVSLAVFQYIPICLVHIASMSLSLANKINGTTIISSFYEFATLSANTGSFMNALAVLYFNKQAKEWVLAKIGVNVGMDQTS